MVVQIDTSTQVVMFLVAEKLATPVIVGWDFCDIHVEAIKPRLTIVEIDGGSTVPMIRQPSKPNTTIPLREEQ